MINTLWDLGEFNARCIKLNQKEYQRTPIGKLTVINNQKTDAKPKPPSGMTTRARDLFKNIVEERVKFDSDSISLLRAFCEAENQHYLATKELDSDGAVILVETKAGKIPRRNPWFDIQKEAAATMNSISTKLRKIGVSSKHVKKSKWDGLLYRD